MHGFVAFRSMPILAISGMAAVFVLHSELSFNCMAALLCSIVAVFFSLALVWCRVWCFFLGQSWWVFHRAVKLWRLTFSCCREAFLSVQVRMRFIVL